MRNILRILIGVVILALAGCVYPGYSYVRGDYGGGYYTGNAYSYDEYAPPYYYDGYGCCGWYEPSISIGLGYYGGYHGSYYGRGYRDYHGRHYRQSRGWRHGASQGHRHGHDSHGSDRHHH